MKLNCTKQVDDNETNMVRWVGCRVMVFMMSGMKSIMSGCTWALYSWYISTTMMGSSASTFSDCVPLGMMLYWKGKAAE